MKRVFPGSITYREACLAESTANGVDLRGSMQIPGVIPYGGASKDESTANDAGFRGFPQVTLRHCLRYEKKLSQQPMAWICGHTLTSFLTLKGAV